MADLSARGAAKRYHRPLSTVLRRARAAEARGDSTLQRTEVEYLAPDWWWEQELNRQVPRGRPRTRPEKKMPLDGPESI